ncbi:hypothetical protein [Streptomyces sp. NPDC048277]|uniref:hypothetical protein n=1 Tax=Streptomyces sp. NPDC048277 TaxID=3155027 RepID=UPI0033CD72A8
MKRGDRTGREAAAAPLALPLPLAVPLALALAVGLTACGRAGGHTASPSPALGTPSPTATTSDDTSASWCAGKVRYNPGAHYAGPGPHPAELIQLDGPGGRFASPRPIDIPAPWAPRVHDGKENTQLLICVSPRSTGTSTSTGRVVGECYYGPVSSAPQRADVVATTYDVTVRAADTGRLVTALRIPADATPEDSCPTLLPEGADLVLRALTPTAITTELKSVLDGPAR